MVIIGSYGRGESLWHVQFTNGKKRGSWIKHKNFVSPNHELKQDTLFNDLFFHQKLFEETKVVNG